MMDIVATPSSGDVRIYPSSVVIKREPLIDCLKDGAVLHLHLPHYHHADSVMQDVKEESTTPGLHGVIEGHQRSLQLTNIPIKQEPLEADLKYPTTWSPINGENEQIPAFHGSLSQTDDQVKFEKTDHTKMCTTTTVLKVEDVRSKGRDVHFPSHSRGIPKRPVPVTLYRLYRHRAEGVTLAENEQTAVGYCEIPLVAREDCLGVHINWTDTCTESEPYCKLRCISGTSPHTDMSKPPSSETFKSVNHQFASSDHLDVHVKSHTAEKPVQLLGCSLCEYRCNKSGQLVAHMRRHTVEKPFRCLLCDYRSARKGSLTVHMVKHTGEKPFKCSLCDYRCAKMGNLNRHMLAHTGDKPFKCSVCDFRCGLKENLKGHMATHTGEKPFKCPQCDYRCGKKSNINIHMMKHTGEKPFKCSQCDYRSATNASLKVHMVRHTGEKPFKCSLCNNRFAHKGNLNKHTKTHIGEKHY